MSLPELAVVIPTRGRPLQLARCLEALRSQTLARQRFEVLVVDDGGDSDPAALHERWQGLLQLQVLQQAHAGPAAARNRGAAAARAELLAFTDDDCLPAPDWLETLLRAGRAHPDALLGGHTVNALPDNLFAEASQSLVDSLRRHYGERSTGSFFPSNNIALTRHSWKRMGGFDTGFDAAAAEDRDLCERFTYAGGLLHRVPEARVLHAHPLDLPGFLRQHFRYGRGAWTLDRRRRSQGREKLSVGPLVLYLELLRGPGRNASHPRPGQVAGLIAVSQLAYALGYLDARIRRGAAPPSR